MSAGNQKKLENEGENVNQTFSNLKKKISVPDVDVDSYAVQISSLTLNTDAGCSSRCGSTSPEKTDINKESKIN